MGPRTGQSDTGEDQGPEGLLIAGDEAANDHDQVTARCVALAAAHRGVTGSADDQLAQRLPQAPDLLREKAMAIGLLLDWLESFPGDDWQARWDNAGTDWAGEAWPDRPCRVVWRLAG